MHIPGVILLKKGIGIISLPPWSSHPSSRYQWCRSINHDLGFPEGQLYQLKCNYQPTYQPQSAKLVDWNISRWLDFEILCHIAWSMIALTSILRVICARWDLISTPLQSQWSAKAVHAYTGGDPVEERNRDNFTPTLVKSSLLTVSMMQIDQSWSWLPREWIISTEM